MMTARTALLALSVLTSACATVPRPVSPVPTPPAQPGLRAGFGRVDITPPPGGGLFGYGPEGKRAVGYRMRLYARALVMEDATGERIAFVVTDLGANSVLVHRYAARATQSLGIGADRMLLAASHTHAGPTHHFGLVHDVFASGGEMGFDWPWAMELSRRVAHAVELAVQDMKPARAGWRTFPVWGITHNRNLLPYSKNKVPWQSRFAAPGGLTPERRAIDPAWSMLKVETLAGGSYRPAGAISIFAMHGTGAPSANDLYDADLHGMVSAAVERGIDRMNNVELKATPDAFHLFAQGSEGDASAMPTSTRCPVPTLINPEQYGANPPLTAMLLAEEKRWEKPKHDAVERCITSSRAHMQTVAQELTKRALDEFASITTSADFPIRRVFTTVYPGKLKGQFCQQPRLGTATLAGPVDGETRQTKARIRYIEQGNSAVDTRPHTDELRRCHGVKRFMEIGVPVLRKITQGNLFDLGLTPREAQVSVVQLGPQILATLPVEMTTTAGGRIKDAIASALQLTDTTRVTTVGIVNGYLNYVATADEYQEQYYEGSSTLFGPNSAEAFKNILVGLAQQLPASNGASPSPVVGKATVWRDPPPLHRFASAREGPERVARCVTRPTLVGDTAVFRFRDWYPGRLMRAAYPLLQLEAKNGAAWEALTWDDDPQLEIRAVRGDRKRGYWWEARWTPDQLPAQWRVVLTQRGPNDVVHGDDPAAICPLTW